VFSFTLLYYDLPKVLQKREWEKHERKEGEKEGAERIRLPGKAEGGGRIRLRQKRIGGKDHIIIYLEASS